MVPKSILVVEDDIGNIVGTVELLKNEGITVEIAASIFEAEEILKTKKFDLMLVDWTMPLNVAGPADTEGGGKLIKTLKSGKLGMKNKAIQYFIITKQTDQFDVPGKAHRGRLGVLSKLDALGIRDCVIKAMGS